MSLPQPVFILASPRSFTSLVCAMLGQHPEAYGVPEINLLIADTIEQLLDFTKGKRQFVLHGLLRAVGQLYAGEQTMQSMDMARRWLNRRLKCSTAEVYQELCQKVAPLRIIDKSPAYPKKSETLERIYQIFPDAYYLYLIRHPKEQGKSMLKAPQAVAELFVADSLDYSTHPPSIEPQYEWYKTQQRILDFLNNVPKNQQMQLRGEDLVNDPRMHLENLCQWLNLAWDESIYEAMLRTEESPYACMGPLGTQWGNNPGFQKSPAFRESSLKPSSLDGALPWRKDKKGLMPEIVELAQELGYS